MRNIYRYIPLLFAFAFTQGCPLLTNEVTYKVISKNAGFTGVEIVDSNNIHYFEDTNAVSGTFSYEQSVGEVKNLEIQATTKAGATYISIKIYKNGELVKEETLANASSQSTIIAQYSYQPSPAATGP